MHARNEAAGKPSRRFEPVSNGRPTTEASKARRSYTTNHAAFNDRRSQAHRQQWNQGPDAAPDHYAFSDNVPLAPAEDGTPPTLAAQVMHAIAIELRHYMETNDLTQADVSTITGIAQATISRILAGQATINVVTLLQLEAATGNRMYLWTTRGLEEAKTAARDRWRETHECAAHHLATSDPDHAAQREALLARADRTLPFGRTA